MYFLVLFSFLFILGFYGIGMLLVLVLVWYGISKLSFPILNVNACFWLFVCVQGSGYTLLSSVQMVLLGHQYTDYKGAEQNLAGLFT